MSKSAAVRAGAWMSLISIKLQAEEPGYSATMETLADFEHPLIRQTAERLTAGKTSARERLNSLFLFVRDEIEFGFPLDGDLVKASETIRRGFGQCNNKGMLFLALCRAAGFKARFHFSTISKEIQKGIFPGIVYWFIPKEISHGWVEVEIDGRWHRIDSYINDLPFHRAAVRELERRGWKTGFSVSGADGEPSADLELDDAHHAQMGAVTGDHGIWEKPAQYLAGPAYLNRPGPLRSWLFKLMLPLVNGRIRRLRAQGQIADAA